MAQTCSTWRSSCGRSDPAAARRHHPARAQTADPLRGAGAAVRIRRDADAGHARRRRGGWDHPDAAEPREGGDGWRRSWIGVVRAGTTRARCSPTRACSSRCGAARGDHHPRCRMVEFERPPNGVFIMPMYVAFVFVAPSLIEDRHDLERIVAAFLIAAGLVSVLAIGQRFIGAFSGGTSCSNPGAGVSIERDLRGPEQPGALPGYYAGARGRDDPGDGRAAADRVRGGARGHRGSDRHWQRRVRVRDGWGCCSPGS